MASSRGLTHSDWHAGNVNPEKISDWKNHIGALVHAYYCTQNSTTGFFPYYLRYGSQPCLPVDVTLGLVPHSVMEPTTSKFVQKLRKHIQWPIKRPNHFWLKRAQHHKLNYNKHSRAAAFEVGDMVLVHVTAFKSHHTIQDQCENRSMWSKGDPIPMYQSMCYPW